MKTRLLCVTLIFSLLFLIGCEQEENKTLETDFPRESEEIVYILNMNSRKIHNIFCYSASMIHRENRSDYYSFDLEPLLEQGFTRCKNCFK